jgi:hypothetical protein
MGAMADDIAAASSLIFTQAQKQLDSQNSDLGSLRTRTVAALSVASLIAGLFGPRVDQNNRNLHTVVGVAVALGAFAVGAIIAILIIAPRRKWIFTFQLDHLLSLVEDRRAAPIDVTHNLAGWMEDARRSNESQLNRLHLLFGGLCCTLGIQVLAWGVSII